MDVLLILPKFLTFKIVDFDVNMLYWTGLKKKTGFAMNSNYFKVCSDSWSSLLQVPSSRPPPCFTRVGPTRPPPPKESTSPKHILLAESSIRFQWIFTLAYVYLYLYMCVGFCVTTYISTKHQLLHPQILHSPLPFSHYTEKGFCVGEREGEHHVRKWLNLHQCMFFISFKCKFLITTVSVWVSLILDC